MRSDRLREGIVVSSRTGAGGRVTIREVAAAAGVSVTTVSHVLNDAPGARVAEATRTRVKEVARELGYGPSRLAQSLRTQRTQMIGFLSEEIATTPHAGQIFVGAQDAAQERDFTLLLVNSPRDASSLSRAAAALLQRQVEGVLYATMFHRYVAVPEDLGDARTVLIDATSADASIPSVVPDEIGGARAAVEELLIAGHRRIGFVTNSDDVPATRGRLVGYRQALGAQRLPFHPELVVADLSESAGGYRAARRLLARDEPPTAIFAYNDRMAMGVYRAAREHGLRIPEDLSVVGFDNQEIISDGLHPGLTTVSLPHYDMGAWAVHELFRLFDGRTPNATEHPVILPCPLVRRASVTAPR